MSRTVQSGSGNAKKERPTAPGVRSRGAIAVASALLLLATVGVGSVSAQEGGPVFYTTAGPLDESEVGNVRGKTGDGGVDVYAVLRLHGMNRPATSVRAG